MFAEKEGIQLIGSFLAVLLLISLASSSVLAGQVTDEFNSDKLDEKLWDMKLEGDATEGIVLEGNDPEGVDAMVERSEGVTKKAFRIENERRK